VQYVFCTLLFISSRVLLQQQVPPSKKLQHNCSVLRKILAGSGSRCSCSSGSHSTHPGGSEVN
jgi:hypothetical protein